MEKTETCQSCEFQEDLDTIRQVPFFSHLALDTLKVIAYLCNRETFKPGEKIFQQKEDDGRAIIILHGKARMIHESESGFREIREYGDGDFLGSLSLVGTGPRLFSLEAKTETACLALERKKFVKSMLQFPDQMPKVFQALVERVAMWEKRFFAEHTDDCESCVKAIGVSFL